MTPEIGRKNSAINASSVCFKPWLISSVHRDDFLALKMPPETGLDISTTV